MQFTRHSYTDGLLRDLYRKLLLPRLIEEKMLLLLRQGKVSKWFSGIGQEAIAVGATAAMHSNEWIMPLHRNLGVFTGREMPLRDLIRQWQGDVTGYSRGRERSFHFGSSPHFICGMISHLGAQLSVADGAALASKLRQEQRAVLAFSGEGGTSEGEFHEALNVAAVWELPVIFLVENNGYGLSTPVEEQYRCENIVDKAIGYGMDGVRIDGNNLLTVYDTVRGVRDYCIANQKPYLIECMTFRMRGHEEASGVKYVPPHLFDEWRAKDPVQNYREYLLQEGVLRADEAQLIEKELRAYIEHEIRHSPLHIGYAAGQSEGSGTKEADGNGPNAEVAFGLVAKKELKDVYAPVPEQKPSAQNVVAERDDNLRFVDAIREGLAQSLEVNENLVLMGQDIAEYGGAFKVTEGLVDTFGRSRIRNTPLCESAILGAALGLSLEGFKSVVEMQFADFVSVGFNQIVNNLAKIHYRWGQKASVVVRMPTGAGVGAGPFHSQSNEAWFFHVPGLKVVYPSTPQDAKGLLIASVNDGNPVMFFEHKLMYRMLSASVPREYYEVEIGKARLVRPGDDLAIITYGMGVIWAEQYADAHPHMSIEILDLRTLLPLDYDAIRRSVHKTGKVLVLHEDTLTGGIGAEVAAWIAQHCFEFLDAPVLRCASLDTPVPFNRELEKNFLASSRLPAMVQKLYGY